MNFFLKFILWVPANHKILSIRLFIWAFTSLAASKEYYEFISNKHCKRVGPFFWVGSFCLGVEFSIAFKFGYSMFTAPFPWYVQIMWAILGCLILLGGIYAYTNEKFNKKYEKIEEDKRPYDPQEPSIDIELIYAKKNN